MLVESESFGEKSFEVSEMVMQYFQKYASHQNSQLWIGAIVCLVGGFAGKQLIWYKISGEACSFFFIYLINI